MTVAEARELYLALVAEGFEADQATMIVGLVMAHEREAA